MNLETYNIMNSEGASKTILTAKTVWEWSLRDGKWFYVHKKRESDVE